MTEQVEDKVEEKEPVFVKGTPPAVLMPARNYVFKLPEENHVLEIPLNGNYHDLDSEFFPEDAGEFHVFHNDIINMPVVTKVLFATKQYPALEFNQFFVIHGIKVLPENLMLVGQIVDMMLVKKDEVQEEKEGE